MMKKLLTVCLILCLAALLCLFVACEEEGPVSIEVITYPDTLYVQQGGEIDLTGGVVAVVYSDGHRKEVPMQDLEKLNLKKDVLGTQTLVLVYREGGKRFSASFDMTVVLPKASALALQTDGVKTTYLDGESFDRKNLVVTASYVTGITATVQTYDISPSVLHVGTTQVTISHGGASATIPVTVSYKAPASADILSLPSKTAYFVGEAVDRSGMRVKVTYNDGAQGEFDEQSIRLTRADGGDFYYPLDKTDTQVIAVISTDFGEATAEFSITVTEVVPVSATLADMDPLSFFVGQSFAFSDEGPIITISYNYGDGVDLYASDDAFSFAEQTLTEGQESVTLWLTDHPSITVEIPVSVVQPELIGIVVRIPPQKLFYNDGEEIALDGLVLALQMSDGNETTLAYSAESGITVSPERVPAGPQSVITVTYEGFTDTFKIN